jgi:exosortase A-associated hydrolase 1
VKEEIPLSFCCGVDRLFGVLHLPVQPKNRGVLVVVGGPQYRVGSHRQFVLLARQLCMANIAVMRFDYRGMGDSEGELGKPEPCDHLTSDIRSAIDCFMSRVPNLQEIILLGLCDGASATMLYAYSDARVTGMVLLNPWMSTDKGVAKTYLKQYYLRRLVSRSFWKKLFRVELKIMESSTYFLRMVGTLIGVGGDNGKELVRADHASSVEPLNDRMTDGFKKFSGRVLLVLSGNDLIAAEFRSMVNTSNQWRGILRSPLVTLYEFTDADHTFSTRKWRDQVGEWVIQWMNY